MSDLHVLRVFTTPSGEHGNELGVFLRGDEIPDDARQGIAAELKFSETVFIDDVERAEIRIFTPGIELPFAGHPTVGVAWLLRESLGEIAVLRAPAGELGVRAESELVWISARPEWSPPFELLEQESPEAVDALDATSAPKGWAYCWAWENEEGGRIRARAFVDEAGIPEDEATGSAALSLCAQVGKPIQVNQGRGSEIFSRPIEDGCAEVGGRVLLDEVREYAL